MVKIEWDEGGAPDLTILACFAGEVPETNGLSSAEAEACHRITAREIWQGRRDQRAEAETSPNGGANAPSVALWGLGEREEFDGFRLGRWLERLDRQLDRGGIRRLRLRLPAHEVFRGDHRAEEIQRRLTFLGYRFDRFRSKARSSPLESIHLLPPPGETEAYARVHATATAIAAGVVWSRDLGNSPPNDATPEGMADRAERLATEHGFSHRVLGIEELSRMGMRAILAVGVGSRNPPCLARLDWGTAGPVVALVGKGVTFDSGGLSLKAPVGMPEMKYDKAGACAVLGIALAVARLELPLRLRLYLPLAENLPGGAAYRPGDIVHCYNGKTVEVLNTDAEGRLLLADTMAWAVEEEPDYLVELSTLTGGSAVALGLQGAALYCPDDAMADGLLEAARGAGEHLWRMPLWPQFLEAVRGEHGDLKNAGGRWGAGSMAAAFLGEFVGGFRRWAHVDIAGPGYRRTGQGGTPSGATGYGVALVVQWLRALVKTARERELLAVEGR